MSRESKNEYQTNLELVDDRTEKDRFREEALRKLAPPSAEVRAAIAAAKARIKKPTVFRRVVRFLRGSR